MLAKVLAEVLANVSKSVSKSVSKLLANVSSRTALTRFCVRIWCSLGRFRLPLSSLFSRTAAVLPQRVTKTRGQPRDDATSLRFFNFVKYSLLFYERPRSNIMPIDLRTDLIYETSPGTPGRPISRTAALQRCHNPRTAARSL
jgi:hypothetical protein